MESDDLAAARGICYGAIISGLFWLAVWAAL